MTRSLKMLCLLAALGLFSVAAYAQDTATTEPSQAAASSSQESKNSHQETKQTRQKTRRSAKEIPVNGPDSPKELYDKAQHGSASKSGDPSATATGGTARSR